jgi:ABC-2 type transport system permease protein
MDSLRNMLVMIELELRRLKHDRTELYTRAVQPILWIVIYGPIMSAVATIPTGGVPYTSYITPGILIQSTTFVAIFYGLTIVWERESGILKKLLITPASRYATVIGRSMASGVRAIFQALVIVPVALIIGVRFVPNIGYFVSALLIIFFASGGFAAISILIASFMKTRERFMGIGQRELDQPSNRFGSNCTLRCDNVCPCLSKLQEDYRIGLDLEYRAKKSH